MPARYFENFNVISYANSVAVDLTERAIMLNKVTSNPYLFYPMDLTNQVRADQIADSYYEDQYLSWAIYLANGVIDPYYQWYQTQENIEELMKVKYNTLEVSSLTQKVKHYRNNWYNSEQITVSTYQAEIEGTILNKYWRPVYKNSSYPIAYERIPEDWIISTNETVSYIVSQNQVFIRDEVVTISYNDANNHTGKAQVVSHGTFSNGSNYVTVQHTSGYVTADLTGSSYIYGKQSGANTIILDYVGYYNANTNATDRSLRGIPLSEAAYWSPVTIYDWEMERNEENKSIKVLNLAYAPQVVSEIKKLLK